MFANELKWIQLTDMPTPEEIQAAAVAIERAIINRFEQRDEPTGSMLIKYAQAALEAAEQVRALANANDPSRLLGAWSSHR
jgi:hypothetical protein